MRTEFDDIELKAYLSGDLSPESIARIEAALETDKQLETRLLKLEPLSEPLRRVFEDLPNESRLPSIPAEQAVDFPSWRRFVPYGLVASCAGLLGLYLASEFASERELSWQEQVAIYQALYVVETVAPLTPTPQGLAIEFARASDAIGIELDPSNYAELPGLTLKRAQILGFEGAPLIQIAFAAETGAPVAFCILKVGGDTGPSTTELSGLPTVHWSRDGYGFMVIGDLPVAQLETLAGRLDVML